MASKIFTTLFLILTTVRLVQSSDTENFSASELQSLGSVLVETYLRYNLIQRLPRVSTMPCFILHHLYKFTAGTCQFCILTGSLTISAVLGPIAQQWYDKWQNENVNVNVNVNKEPTRAIVTSKINPSHCKNDFGCDRGICWRTCNKNMKNTNNVGWCYSAPDVKAHKYQLCNFSHECSGCWHCIGPCNV